MPVAAVAATSRSRAMTSASVAPPTTNEPRSGALPATAVDRAGVGVETANERGSASGRIRPGTYSSATTWKLVPPKPKALTPADLT